MENCLFCKIINGEIPSSIVYQNDDVVAFKDINPQAPVHILVVPKKHIQCALDSEAADGKMLSAVFSAIAKIAKENKLDNGFRIINNCGADGGQTVPHLHFHLLGGRVLGDKVV
jgi:histidine triad (HIT) family protein